MNFKTLYASFVTITTRYHNIVITISASIVLILPFALALNNPIITGYTEFFIFNSHKINSLFYTWQQINLGQNSASGIWRLFPLDTFYYFLNYVIQLPPTLTHALFLMMMAFVGYVSFNLFMKENFHETTNFSRAIGSLLFVFNIYTVLLISSSFVFIIPYYLFPLQLLLVSRALKSEKHIKYAIIIALVNTLSFGVNLAFTAISVGGMIAYGLWEVLVVKSYKITKLMKFLLMMGTATLLLISWWLVPMIYSALIDNQTTQHVLTSENFNGRDSTVINVFRNLGDWSFFSGHKGQPFHNYAHLYKNNYIFVFASFLPIILVVFSLIYINNKKSYHGLVLKRLWLYYALIVILLPVVGGTNQTWASRGVINWIFNNVPFALAFRSTYKFMGVIVFALSVCLTYLLYLINKRAESSRNKSIIKTSIGLLFIAMLIINSWPLWAGNMYRSDVKYTGLPSYWEKMAQYINTDAKSDEDRVMLLPDQYFPAFQWKGVRKTLPSDLTEIKFDIPSVHGVCKGCAPYNTENTIHFIYNNYGKPNMDKYLGIINVNKILQRDDFDFKYYNVTPPELSKKQINSYSSSQLNTKIGPLTLFNINSTIVNPRIYSPNKLVGVQNPEGILAALDRENKSVGFITDENNSATKPALKKVINQSFRFYDPRLAKISGHKIEQSFTVNEHADFALALKTKGSNKPIPTIENLKNRALTIKPNRLMAYELKPGTYNIVSDIILDDKNLLKNGSFEEGYWQPRVGNCYRQHPGVRLNMRLVADATKGKKALELSGNQDTACSQSDQISDFSKNHDYLVSFDYKSLSGTGASYCVFDGIKCISSKSLENTRNIWKHASIPVKTDEQSNQLKVFLYAPAQDGIKTVARFDAITVNSIKENIIDSLDLYPNKEKELKLISIDRIEHLSPAKYKIYGRFREGGILAYSESFHPGWKAYISTAVSPHRLNLKYSSSQNKRTEIKDHFVINGFANGWMLDSQTSRLRCEDPVSACYISLEYSPQKMLNISAAVSLSSLIVLTIFLYFMNTRNNKSN